VIKSKSQKDQLSKIIIEIIKIKTTEIVKSKEIKHTVDINNTDTTMMIPFIIGNSILHVLTNVNNEVRKCSKRM